MLYLERRQLQTHLRTSSHILRITFFVLPLEMLTVTTLDCVYVFGWQTVDEISKQSYQWNEVKQRAKVEAGTCRNNWLAGITCASLCWKRDGRKETEKLEYRSTDELCMEGKINKKWQTGGAKDMNGGVNETSSLIPLLLSSLRWLWASLLSCWGWQQSRLVPRESRTIQLVYSNLSTLFLNHLDTETEADRDKDCDTSRRNSLPDETYRHDAERQTGFNRVVLVFQSLALHSYLPQSLQILWWSGWWPRSKGTPAQTNPRCV